MKLYELSQLPFKERFKFVNDLLESNTELSTDEKLVIDIFEATNEWFQKPTNQCEPNLISKLKDEKWGLPPFFETIYEIQEKYLIEKLSKNERQRIFDECKETWCLYYPDFYRISEIMLEFNTNEMLVEFRKHSPPSFIRERASEVYKKCLSYKVKLKNHKIDNLGYSYTPGSYCIDFSKVILFTNEYADWGQKASYFWNKIYSLQDKYNSLYAYEDWKRYIKHSEVLKEKKEEIQKLHDDTLTLLNAGNEMVLKHNKAITEEYNTNAFEMSIYERELEIALTCDVNNASEEEYCYVYTLECELFVFYVGIAGSPRERFEQHIRGAFSNESNLFKSKFIQKFHSEVKQKIIYEGTRRDCKKFEREYISKYNPLGNMTEGGEG
ncbi:GIY-YIG nuclease family protein [Flavobacterium sp.]|uniref:GIY-YIG nuclease family protein n=1 Tax=Flavobacterium sp. TaxID=239 RepID=UPI0025C0614A|nr:GIY-YIG nuclease family protein [Flavobacterium sp.]MBA4153959.1 hypothetical protein [Flavobacterium sp.]